MVIMSLCSTFHTIYIARTVCLQHAQEGRKSSALVTGRGDVQISRCLSHFYVCVIEWLCVCSERNYGRPNLTLWEV